MFPWGGVNYHVNVSNPILANNAVLTNSFDFSATTLNLSLWQTLQNILKTDSNAGLNLIHLPADLYAKIKSASDILLGQVSSHFFCSFKVKNIKELDALLDSPKIDPFDNSPLVRKFNWLYWMTVWSMAKTTPMRTMLMFELPDFFVQHLATTDAPKAFNFFLAAASHSIFELRYNSGILRLQLDGINHNVLKFIQVIQSIGRDDIIHKSIAYNKPQLTPNMIANLITGNITASELSKQTGIPLDDIIESLNIYNKARNGKTYSDTFAGDHNIKFKRLQKESAEYLFTFGLTIPIVSELTQLTPAQTRTILDNMRKSSGLLPDITSATCFYRRYTKDSRRQPSCYCIASLYLSLYLLMGGETVFRSVNQTAMVYAYQTTKDICQSPFFKTLKLPFFHPADAYYWAKAIREDRGRFEYCPQCGCLYPIEVDSNSEKEEGVDNMECPFCYLVKYKMRLSREKKEMVKFALKIDHLPL